MKGVNFVGLRDAGDPVELGCRYSKAGADELVFLDITATHEKRSTLVDMVRRTSEAVTIPFTVGGGISSINGINELLRHLRRASTNFDHPTADQTSTDDRGDLWADQWKCVESLTVASIGPSSRLIVRPRPA